MATRVTSSAGALTIRCARPLSRPHTPLSWRAPDGMAQSILRMTSASRVLPVLDEPSSVKNAQDIVGLGVKAVLRSITPWSTSFSVGAQQSPQPEDVLSWLIGAGPLSARLPTISQCASSFGMDGS